MERTFTLRSYHLATLLAALLPALASAQEGPRFELVMGGGTDPYGGKTRQLFLAPGIGTFLSEGGAVELRAEADLQIIQTGREQVVVGGVAPFFRLALPTWEVRPFAEIGLGVNLTSSGHIDGRPVGGPILFSTMPGAGIAFPLARGTMSIAYRFRHISNARLYKSNAGFNAQFLLVSFAM